MNLVIYYENVNENDVKRLCKDENVCRFEKIDTEKDVLGWLEMEDISNLTVSYAYFLYNESISFQSVISLCNFTKIITKTEKYFVKNVRISNKIERCFLHTSAKMCKDEKSSLQAF